VRDIGIAGGVDHPPREDCLATGLGLGDDTGHGIAIHDRGDEHPVQHRANARLLDQAVGDHLEALGIEFVGQRLRFRHRGAHRVGALLELAADTVGLHGLLVAVPRHALDTDHGDVAAEATETLDQRDLGAGARGGERGRKTPGTRPHHQHVGAMHDVDLARGLADGSL